MLLTPNGFRKLRARAALKGHWQSALLIALIANLPSLLVQGIANMAGLGLANNLTDVLYSSINNLGQIDLDNYSAAVEKLLANTGVWLMQGAIVLISVITPFLSLGFWKWLLDRTRGREDSGITTVFSRTSLLLKGIGLKLWVSLLVFVFMLPGIAVCVLSLVPLWITSIPAFSRLNASVGLFYSGLLACLILGIVAYLKYALSEVLLADHPDWSVIQTARQSKSLMNGHRKELFFLMLGFILWYFLQTYLVMAVTTMGGSIPGLMVGLLCSIALQVYIRASVCVFALELQGENIKARVSEQNEGEAL